MGDRKRRDHAHHHDVLSDFDELMNCMSSLSTSSPPRHRGKSKHASSPERHDPDIFYASRKGHVQEVRRFIKNGDHVNTKDRKDKNKTPLHHASENDHADVLEYLLDHGADENAFDDDLRTPLCLASLRGHASVVRGLVKHGAHIDVKDKNEMTPLHGATTNTGDRATDIVDTLLHHHADVGERDYRWRTPLHNACVYSCFEVVHLLLKIDTDVNATDIDSNTPLHLAAKRGKPDICKALLRKGAFPLDTNIDGSTPLDVAKSSTRDVIKAYMEQGGKKEAFKVPHAPKDAAFGSKFSWTKCQLLGCGSFGKVFLCKDNKRRKMAVKEIELDGSQLKNKEINNEIEVLKSVHHPNIVGYIGSEHGKDKLFIFMEYMPEGAIRNVLKKEGPFKESRCQGFTKQILMGLAYLHDKEVIHRDIKGDNILLDGHGIAKLADFGLSKCVRSLPKMTRKRGTYNWMAPEVLLTTSYGKSADIWSIGCTIVEMLTEQPPWPSADEDEIKRKLPECNYTPSYNLPKCCSSGTQDILNQCFKKPERRATAKELLKLPFCIKSK